MQQWQILKEGLLDLARSLISVLIFIVGIMYIVLNVNPNYFHAPIKLLLGEGTILSLITNGILLALFFWFLVKLEYIFKKAIHGIYYCVGKLF